MLLGPEGRSVLSGAWLVGIDAGIACFLSVSRFLAIDTLWRIIVLALAIGVASLASVVALAIGVISLATIVATTVSK